MPFKSKKQMRKCYALKRQGKAKGWDCKEWSEATNYKELPEKKKKEKSALANRMLVASFFNKLANKTKCAGFRTTARRLILGDDIVSALKAANTIDDEAKLKSACIHTVKYVLNSRGKNG